MHSIALLKYFISFVRVHETGRLDFCDLSCDVDTIAFPREDESYEIGLFREYLKTGYNEGFWQPLEEYRELSEKYRSDEFGYPPVQVLSGDEFEPPANMRVRHHKHVQKVDYSIIVSKLDWEKIIPKKDYLQLKKLKRNLMGELAEIIKNIRAGKPLKKGCDYSSTASIASQASQTMTLMTLLTLSVRVIPDARTVAYH